MHAAGAGTGAGTTIINKITFSIQSNVRLSPEEKKKALIIAYSFLRLKIRKMLVTSD